MTRKYLHLPGNPIITFTDESIAADVTPIAPAPAVLAALKASPWGYTQHISRLADGIYSVSTPSHGGIWVAPERNSDIPTVWRRATWERNALSGFYEEDCDWCLVALTFPAAFTPGNVALARRIFNGTFTRPPHGLPAVVECAA